MTTETGTLQGICVRLHKYKSWSKFEKRGYFQQLGSPKSQQGHDEGTMNEI